MDDSFVEFAVDLMNLAAQQDKRAFPPETYETYSLKCPYCERYADHGDPIHDCEDDDFYCDYCEKTYIATVSTHTVYEAKSMEQFCEENKQDEDFAKRHDIFRVPGE